MAHVAIKCKISIFFAIMKPVGIKKSKMHKKMSRRPASTHSFCCMCYGFGIIFPYQTIPCAIMALATFMKPATLAPFT